MSRISVTKIFDSIKVALRRRARKNPLLGCFLKFIYHLRSENFQMYVSRYVENRAVSSQVKSTRFFRIDTMGDANPGRIILYNVRDSGIGGFCAEWFYWFNRLAFADITGFSFYLNWEKSRYYKESKLSEDNSLMPKTDNIFEYYFVQPSGLSLRSVLKSKNLIFDCDDQTYGFYDFFAPGREDDYILDESTLKRCAGLQKKYIKLNPATDRYVKDGIRKLLEGKKAIAVHARGGDAKVPYKGHPVPVEAQAYSDKARKLMAETGAGYVFLATDDNGYLDHFKKEFGEQLLYYDDVERSDGTRMSCFGKTGRSMHHYKLGLEIIRDVYTMASCIGFVYSNSYVGHLARVINLSQDRSFQAVYQFSNEIRKNGLNLTDPFVLQKVEAEWQKELGKKQEKRKKNDQ